MSRHPLALDDRIPSAANSASKVGSPGGVSASEDFDRVAAAQQPDSRCQHLPFATATRQGRRHHQHMFRSAKKNRHFTQSRIPSQPAVTTSYWSATAGIRYRRRATARCRRKRRDADLENADPGPAGGTNLMVQQKNTPARSITPNTIPHLLPAARHPKQGSPWVSLSVESPLPFQRFACPRAARTLIRPEPGDAAEIGRTARTEIIYRLYPMMIPLPTTVTGPPSSSSAIRLHPQRPGRRLSRARLFVGMGVMEIRRLKQLEEENAKLKRPVADRGRMQAALAAPTGCVRGARRRFQGSSGPSLSGWPMVPVLHSMR
jgi:hypothetical protein